MALTQKKTIESILSHSVVEAASSLAARGNSDGDREDPPLAVAVTSATATGAESASSSADPSPVHLLRVKWTDGSTSSEPVSRLVRDGPDHLLAVVRYLQEHDLLVQTATAHQGDGSASPSSSWSQQLPEHIRRQLPIFLLPDESHPSYACDLRHLDAIDHAFRTGFAGLAHSNRKRRPDSSYRTLRRGVFEVFVKEAATQLPTGITAGTGVGEEGQDGADATGRVVVQKGSAKFRSIIAKLPKEKVRQCFPKRVGRLGDQSIEALTSFARRTAGKDPSLAEVKRFATAQPPAEDGAPPLSDGEAAVTPASSEDGNEASADDADKDATQGTKKEEEHDDDGTEDGVVFGSYSCLVSAAGTEAQFRHVDAHPYERQYSMAISGNGSRPTVTQVVVDELETPEQVMKVWTELVREYAKVYPSFDRGSDVLSDDATLDKVAASLLNMMKESESITEWISNYGKVLSRPSRTVEICGTWSPGTVVSVPGGNVHHAPPNDDFRGILFFTSSPAGMDAYDVDLQFSGPTLAASIVLALWDGSADLEHHHEFLRRVLYVCVLEEPCPVDFTGYLSDFIPKNDPVRQIMLEAHAHKTSSTAKAAATDAPPSSTCAVKKSAPAKAATAADASSSSSLPPPPPESSSTHNLRPRKKQRQ